MNSRGVEPEIVAGPDDRNPGGLAIIHAMPTSFRARKDDEIVIDPSEYVVGAADTIDDVDLDTEVVRLKDGRRLTNELAEQLAEEALAKVRQRNLVPGRKSLSRGTVHSPRVQFRVPESLRAAAEERVRGRA